MNHKSKDTSDDEMLPEYDFDPSEGVRGKYYKRMIDAGFVPIMLDPDVGKVFGDNDSVNSALRGLIEYSKKATAVNGQSKRRCAADKQAVKA